MRAAATGKMDRVPGHPQTLVASHPGNANAATYGVYSGRVLAPRAAEIRDALMTLPHVQPLDILAAEEIGSTIAPVTAFGRPIMTVPSASRHDHIALC